MYFFFLAQNKRQQKSISLIEDLIMATWCLCAFRLDIDNIICAENVKHFMIDLLYSSTVVYFWLNVVVFGLYRLPEKSDTVTVKFYKALQFVSLTFCFWKKRRRKLTYAKNFHHSSLCPWFGFIHKRSAFCLSVCHQFLLRALLNVSFYYAVYICQNP